MVDAAALSALFQLFVLLHQWYLDMLLLLDTLLTATAAVVPG